MCTIHLLYHSYKSLLNIYNVNYQNYKFHNYILNYNFHLQTTFIFYKQDNFLDRKKTCHNCILWNYIRCQVCYLLAFIKYKKGGGSNNHNHLYHIDKRQHYKVNHNFYFLKVSCDKDNNHLYHKNIIQYYIDYYKLHYQDLLHCSLSKHNRHNYLLKDCQTHILWHSKSQTGFIINY